MLAKTRLTSPLILRPEPEISYCGYLKPKLLSHALHQPTATLLALLVGMVGVLLIAVAQIRLMIGQISLEQNMPPLSLGTGLIGISILISILLSRNSPQVPTGFVWLGMVSGLFLAVVGILGGVLLPKDIYLLVTGGSDWSHLNPLLYVFFVAAPISQLDYPVWAIWLGRLILNNDILPPT